MAKHRRLLILCLVGVLISARPLLGQSTNAAITGQITDPLKAVIVQAKVTAINNNTNVRYGGTTNQTGSYLIPSVPPGDYRIEVEKTGFKTIVKPDVILHVQDTIELNFEMALGSASETVTVTGAAGQYDGCVGQHGGGPQIRREHATEWAQLPGPDRANSWCSYPKSSNS